MPSSSYAGIVEYAIFLDSRVPFEKGDTVIDIGCGIGKMGFIVREFSDYRWGYFKKEEFTINLIGVDIWPAYLQEVQKAIYSELVVSEALQFLMKFEAEKKRAKLIVISHVLEHMEREHGWKVLHLARKISDWTIAILPLVKTPQEPIWGNKFEAHISEWTLNELEAISEFCEVRGLGKWPNGVFLMKGT